jgi:magnesium chelatase subunit D
MEIAGEIKDDSRIKTVVIDVEKPGLISFGLAYQLSIHMGAKYFKLEDLRADTLVEVLKKEILEY